MTPDEQTNLLRQHAHDRMEELCAYLIPGGRKSGRHWVAGSIDGEKGDSWNMNLRTGVFGDFATDPKMHQGAIDLWMQARKVDFGTAKRELADWLGTPMHLAHELKLNKEVSPPNQGRELKPFSWVRYVANVTLDRREELHNWRGLSREYIDRLVAAKRIGALHNGGWALPVVHEGKVVSAHCRSTDEKGNAYWFYPQEYCPSRLGIGIQPLVHGNLAKASTVYAFESPWDQMAVGDRLNLHRDHGVATVSTRGAANASLLACVPQAVRIVLWPQSDEAGQKWLSDAQNTISSHPVSVARVPKGFKDVGDFIKGGASVEELRNAFKKERPPIAVCAFPVMESLIASEWERELKQEFYRIHEERIYRAQSIEHEVYHDSSRHIQRSF
jgi:hypothetical protein